jgi:hypothetical protein
MKTGTLIPLIPQIAFALILCALPRPTAAGCPEIQKFLADKAKGLSCFHADDLMSSNTAQHITPDDNSITTFADGATPLPGTRCPADSPLCGGGFTPIEDKTAISNDPTNLPHRPVPGIQVQGWFANDPAGEARFLLRFPDDWNGRLVVAGASATRSEFNGDLAWSDYVVSRGYAYASQNKGVLNFFFVSSNSDTQPKSDPSSCRLSPNSPYSKIWVHFYDDDIQQPSARTKPFTQWTRSMIATASIAKKTAKANYHRFPRYTYAVGTSNGGYQVRRAIEEAPGLFDGGVDWEGTFIDREENLLVRLPPAIKHFTDYQASNYDPKCSAANAIVEAGYPPDIVNRNPDTKEVDSLWLRHANAYWEVTQCQWQKRFDPSWVTYASNANNVAGTGGYDYFDRVAHDPSIRRRIAAVETTGKIKRPLLTVAGTMDTLLPIKWHARAYEVKVNASRKVKNDRKAPYRLYEVQNGNHVESYASPTGFPQLVPIEPHAQKAFDLLVDHVENNAPLPPSQCIPKGGSISPDPSQPGHCADLFVP